MMGCVDFDVLMCSLMFWSDLVLIMEMAQSIGTNVERAFTSHDVIPSPCLIDLTSSINGSVFLMSCE